MRKYFIFSINKEFYETYKQNEEILFKTLSNLYNHTNVDKGLRIYQQVCNPINKDIVGEHFKNQNKYQKFEKSLLEINYSCLVLETEGKIPKKVKTIKYYEAPLFVTDFKNKKYFWLT